MPHALAGKNYTFYVPKYSTHFQFFKMYSIQNLDKTKDIQQTDLLCFDTDCELCFFSTKVGKCSLRVYWLLVGNNSSCELKVDCEVQVDGDNLLDGCSWSIRSAEVLRWCMGWAVKLSVNYLLSLSEAWNSRPLYKLLQKYSNFVCLRNELDFDTTQH